MGIIEKAKGYKDKIKNYVRDKIAENEKEKELSYDVRESLCQELASMEYSFDYPLVESWRMASNKEVVSREVRRVAKGAFAGSLGLSLLSLTNVLPESLSIPIYSATVLSLVAIDAAKQYNRMQLGQAYNCYERYHEEKDLFNGVSVKEDKTPFYNRVCKKNQEEREL